MSRLDLSAIEAGLSTYIIGKQGENELWPSLASTSDRAIELAHAGAPEGVVVLARQQSGGRGRQGRIWVSPPDAGIFLSVILRPTIDATLLPLFSFACGVAAAQAIEKVGGIKIGLKWVNDLVFEGKKLGGILAEIPGSQKVPAASGGWVMAPAVILGIGINLSLKEAELPEELKAKVESLDHLLASEIDANALVAELLNSLEEQYNHLRHGAPELVLGEWRSYCLTLGKLIKARVGNEELEGQALDIDESGALILGLDSGEKRILHAGEITVRLENGNYA
ncbi:MAG: biotin--[acetyl-CoA-carboxylase] ligase [Candidatus Obscuribacterales bacterium]|nr:biotin--[acetyl-CoA-carboxylase] ligase [Candidatus Obscuribacterales bacterium]